MGAAPPRPRRVGSATAAPRAGACCLWGAGPPTPPSRTSTRCARLWPTRPPSEFRSVGAAPPRPRRVGSATAAPRPRACRLWGAAPPTPPSRTSARCARLWPTHPPSEFRSVGAQPPRPRRVGSAIAAPRAGARCLWGAGPPTPPSRGSTRCARLSPPARPRSFFLWGLRPHAPDGLAAQPGPRGRARVVYGGRSPPRLHRGRARAARGSGPPARPRSFFVGAQPPRPRKGWQRNRGAEGGRASLHGCARHPAGPAPGCGLRERGATCAGDWGAVALDFHSTQLVLLRLPGCSEASWGPGRAPTHEEVNAPRRDATPPGARGGCGGPSPPHEERIRGGWVGQSRAQRVLVRVPRKQQAPRRPRDQRALPRQSPCWPWPPPAAWISLPRTASSRSRIATASSAASWS